MNGGSVNLGTAPNPGGNVLDVNGAGVFLEDSTSAPVPDYGNTLEVDMRADQRRLSEPDESWQFG